MKSIKYKITSVLLAAALTVLSSCTGTVQPAESSVSSEPEPVPEITDAYPGYKSVIDPIETGSTRVNWRASDGYMYRQSDDSWGFTYINGVVIGLSEPAADLLNPETTYATYMDWFEKISDMNANTVRVKTVMNANFYKALYSYNAEHPKKLLYLLQDISAENIGEYSDELLGLYKAETDTVLDVIHGKGGKDNSGEKSTGTYDSDVSSYVVGFIINGSFTSGLIADTNSRADSVFSGSYLYTDDSSTGFEAFLAACGDYVISQETSRYGHQTPVAFMNSPETDVLSHPGEENAVSFNTEHIKSTAAFLSGLFAAVKAQTATPGFINTQSSYTEYINPTTGSADPYRAYISELKKQYSVPVIVAETGLSTSRTVSEKSVAGYSYGGISEKAQGDYLALMVTDAAKEAYAGSVIYSWQDEWQNETWNALNFGTTDDKKRTPDVCSAMQSSGILAFDAASGYSDGSSIEWMGASPVISNDSYEVYAKYDAAYLHIYVNVKKDFNFETDTLYIPISVTGLGSTKSTENNITFSENADRLLVINGKDNTRVLTDAYCDLFHWKYAVNEGVFEKNADYSVQGAGIYNKIMSLVSYSSASGEPVSEEKGLLRFGINNPNLAEYDSLADFYSTGKKTELRIPWSVLGVANAASGMAVNDFYSANEAGFTKINDIKIGIGASGETVTLQSINFDGLTTVTYRTRLKKAYDTLKNTYTQLFKQ